MLAWVEATNVIHDFPLHKTDADIQLGTEISSCLLRPWWGSKGHTQLVGCREKGWNQEPGSTGKIFRVSTDEGSSRVSEGCGAL